MAASASASVFSTSAVTGTVWSFAIIITSFLFSSAFFGENHGNCLKNRVFRQNRAVRLRAGVIGREAGGERGKAGRGRLANRRRRPRAGGFRQACPSSHAPTLREGGRTKSVQVKKIFEKSFWAENRGLIRERSRGTPL